MQEQVLDLIHRAFYILLRRARYETAEKHFNPMQLCSVVVRIFKSEKSEVCLTKEIAKIVKFLFSQFFF